jgi:hypothetical protein
MTDPAEVAEIESILSDVDMAISILGDEPEPDEIAHALGWLRQAAETCRDLRRAVLQEKV